MAFSHPFTQLARRGRHSLGMPKHLAYLKIVIKNNNNKNKTKKKIKTTRTIRLAINNQYSLYLNCLSSYLWLKSRLSFIKTKRLVRITLNGLMNGKRSVLTILQLNNGCSHQDPVLVAFLRYFESFSSQNFYSCCFKERLFIRWPGFPS